MVGLLNGLGITATADEDGRRFFSVPETARLLGLGQSTVERRTRLDASDVRHLPAESLVLAGRREQRWVRADCVETRRAVLLGGLGAHEAPTDPSEAEEGATLPASSPSGATEAEAIPEAEAEVHLRSRVAELEEQVRLLQEDKRDLLTADVAKTDIIRRHIPIETLND